MSAHGGLDIAVRRAKPEDHGDLMEVWTCPGVVRNTLRLPLGAPDLWDRWKRLLAATDLGSDIWVAQVDCRVVGTIVVTYESGLRSHVARVGIEVHDDYQNKGEGRQLVSAAIDHAETQLGKQRIELHVFTDNEPTIGLYKKFSFEIEGVHRSFGFREGQYVDVYSMARVTV